MESNYGPRINHWQIILLGFVTFTVWPDLHSGTACVSHIIVMHAKLGYLDLFEVKFIWFLCYWSKWAKIDIINTQRCYFSHTGLFFVIVNYLFDLFTETQFYLFICLFICLFVCFHKTGLFSKSASAMEKKKRYIVLL